MFNVSIEIFYEIYDWCNYSMIKGKFKKINNLTTTTHVVLGAIVYITNRENNACSLMCDSRGSWGVDSEARFPNPSDQTWLNSIWSDLGG